MTEPTLLHRFVREECTTGVIALLRRELGEATRRWHEFNFNVFDVEIDVDANEVVISDVLEASSEQRLRLDEFLAALDSATKSPRQP